MYIYLYMDRCIYIYTHIDVFSCPCARVITAIAIGCNRGHNINALAISTSSDRCICLRSAHPAIGVFVEQSSYAAF